MVQICVCVCICTWYCLSLWLLHKMRSERNYFPFYYAELLLNLFDWMNCDYFNCLILFVYIFSLRLLLVVNSVSLFAFFANFSLQNPDNSEYLIIKKAAAAWNGEKKINNKMEKNEEEKGKKKYSRFTLRLSVHTRECRKTVAKDNNRSFSHTDTCWSTHLVSISKVYLWMSIFHRMDLCNFLRMMIFTLIDA